MQFKIQWPRDFGEDSKLLKPEVCLGMIMQFIYL